MLFNPQPGLRLLRLRRLRGRVLIPPIGFIYCHVNLFHINSLPEREAAAFLSDVKRVDVIIDEFKLSFWGQLIPLNA